MQLGDGTMATVERTLLQVTDLSGAIALAAGGDTCALKDDSTVRCWRWNKYTQLGEGSAWKRTPVEVVASLRSTGKESH